METGHISVQTENIFPIIKKFLYSDHEIFLREIISNAVDATSKLKTIASKGDFKGELGDLTIDVIINNENGTLTVKDRGIGLTEAETKKYLNQVAFSSATDFIKKYKEDANIIGHFGLGFYSAFMVSEKVEVVSKSYKKSVKGIKWTCTGSPEYSIQKDSKKDRGTEVVMYIDEENNEFLEKDRVESLLQKYCKFLPFEIRFGKTTNYSYEGEGEEQKTIEEEVDNIINNTKPSWRLKPGKLKDEDYQNFYRELYPMGDTPLFWIHLNIDYPFNLTGILYFPKISNSIEVQKNKIQLYSNQVYVTDDVSNIVPEFLTLLHGVIDSPDIPLNVSRSYLQSDANVRKISSYITKKVAEKLNSLFKKDRENYESKWDEIGTFVKYGMISDEKFNEKASKFALLKNLDSKYFTLEEYKEKVKDLQTDKYNKTVLLYTNNPKEHHSYIDSAKANSYDVLQLDHLIDNHFLQHLEYKSGDITFVRVDSDTTDKLVQKEETKESVLSEKEEEKLKKIFEDSLPESTGTLSFQALSPTDYPVVITKPEFMRRMKEMQSLQGVSSTAFPDSFNIVVNTNHTLVAEKLMRMKSPEKKQMFAKYLYNLALLNQNMLKGEELNKFVKKSLDLIG